MHRQILLTIGVACTLMCAGLAVADDAKKENSESARNCIQTRTLKSTAVVDDWNVLFVKKGNSVYHNELPKECKGLSLTKQFSYKTTGGSLCSQDTIRVVDPQGREGRACQLGKFRTISTDELRTLVESSRNPANGAAKKAPDETNDDDAGNDD